MKRFGIDSIRMQNADQGMMERCGSLYCRVWQEPPWNENFWKPSHVFKKISKAMKMPNFAGLLAVEENDVRGFTWGFEVRKHDLRRISSGAMLDFIFVPEKKVFYVAELGVEKGYRNKGAGESLSKLLLQKAGELGMKIITLRTDDLAIPAKRLYARLGFEEHLIRDGKFPARAYWILEL